MVTEMKQPPRRAYEIMGKVISRGDAMELSRIISRSPQLVTAWCREPMSRKEAASGRTSPLDTLRALILMVKEDDGAPDRAYPIGDYIASLLNGVFVPLLQPSLSPGSDMLARLSRVLKETGEVIESARQVGFEGETNSAAKAACIKDIDAAIVALVQLKLNICPNGR
jgi:hypothetical protein